MGIRTRRARKHSRTHIAGFGAAGLFGFIALVVIALAFSVGSIVEGWLQDLPDFDSPDAYVVSEPTTVYDSKGNVIAEFMAENRRNVELSEISPYVLTGTVDTEDIRFYQHNGVDPQGIARAALVTLVGGSEGASTIDQQLVRNTVLSDEQFDRTLKRKVREAYIAVEMEKKYSKDQILNMYLNTIYYGNGAYGIEAAAKTYFNTTAKDLTLAQAALLVGIPNSPTMFDPTQNPEASVKRRNLVLKRMLDAGDISQEEYDEAYNTPLELNPGSNTMSNTGVYPYWTQYIKEVLSEDFSSDTVMKGGLKVYTTIDPDAQQEAQKAVSDRLEAIGQEGLESALVAVDPSTGYIKAMVGGSDFSKNQVNLATQGMRQPGSSFKAFTLVAAIRDGMDPDVYLNCNSPLKVSSNWTVKNYGGVSYGTITLRKATELSSNTGYVQVAQAVGGQSIVKCAKDMGITEDLPAYDSITLGTIPVPVIQMAEAYSTLASGGVHRDAVAITKIEDRNGNQVYEHKDTPTQALDPAVAAAATDVLEGVVTSGSGTAKVVSSYGIDQPIAGKTGTTEYADNLWFCGYTPQIAVAVWTGYPDSSKTVFIDGSDGHPSNSSCPIFGQFVKAYLGDTPRAEFPDADARPTYKANSTWSFAKNTGSSSNGGSRSSSRAAQTPPEETTVTEETTTTTTTEQPTAPTDNGQGQGGATTPTTPSQGGATGGDAAGGTGTGGTGGNGGTGTGGGTGGGAGGNGGAGGDTAGGTTPTG